MVDYLITRKSLLLKAVEHALDLLFGEVGEYPEVLEKCDFLIELPLLCVADDVLEVLFLNDAEV